MISRFDPWAEEFDFPIVALDGNHAPEQLGRRNGRIIVTQTVAAGNQARIRGKARGGQPLFDPQPDGQIIVPSAKTARLLPEKCPAGWLGWIETKSPGRMEGTMLVPKTRRRTSPNVRTISSASPHASSIEAFPDCSVSIFSGWLRSFLNEIAAALRAREFAARQRRDLEHRLESHGWRLVRFLSRPPVQLSSRLNDLV